MKAIKLDLSTDEKQKIKEAGVKMGHLTEYAADEISTILNVEMQRALELSALINFQSIPSIGPKFARDLISLGYYSIDNLVNKDGAALLNELERKQGFWTDPCVEDQCRLIVHHARHRGSIKNWWDFTAERKAYRVQFGYPADRPVRAWYDNEIYEVPEAS